MFNKIMINKIKDAIDYFRSNKDGKTVTKNFSYLMALQIVGYIFPLITIPYLARIIGTEGFGKIAFASAVMIWFKTITDWGFNYTATRDLSKNKDDPSKVSEIFSNVLWAKIALMLVSLSLLSISIYFIPIFNENKSILIITFLIIPGWILSPEWFFQAMEKMKYITIFSLISRTIFTMLIFLFIKEKEDFILQPLFMSLGQILCGFFAIYLILSKWGVRLQKPNIPNIVRTVKGSTDVFINNLMPNLYTNFSVVLLSFFGGSAATGVFDAANKFIQISDQFLKVISRAAFPLLSRKINMHNLYEKILFLTAIVFSIVLFIFAPFIINLFYTNEFSMAILALRILSIGVIFDALISIYGINYMIIKGYEKSLKKITTVWSVFGFFISFPLIYFHGYIGACFTIVITKCLLGLHTAYSAKKLT